MLLSQQDARHIVEEMKAAIHHDLNIMDKTGVILASTNPNRCGQLHTGALRVIQSHLPVLIIHQDNPADGVQQGINLPITMEGETIGVIGITGPPEEVSVFGEIIKRMTEVLVAGLRQQEQSDLLARARGLFMENWLFSSHPDLAELEVRGRLLGISISAPYTVALVQTAARGSSDCRRTEDLSEMQNSLFLRTIQGHIGNNRQNFCTVIRNRIIVLLCRSSREEAFSIVSRICSDIQGFYPVSVRSGISSSSRNPMDIRRCYLEAQTASSIAVQSGQQIVFYDQVSLEFIVQSIPLSIRQDLRQIIFSSCSPEEQEEFTQIIRLYFQCGRNINACAKQSFVHRNTFQYRMDRLKKKLGYNLKIPKDSLLLFLASQNFP